MKRALVLLGTLCLCVVIPGCSGDPREEAINSVVNLMNTSAGAIKDITAEVKAATDKTVKNKAAFDLEEATKATKKLQKIGEEAQKIKVNRVDVAPAASEDEKKEFANRHRNAINSAYKLLLEEKKALNDELTKAEAIDADAKKKVEELRTKIREAEGPFETLARQQG